MGTKMRNNKNTLLSLLLFFLAAGCAIPPDPPEPTTTPDTPTPKQSAETQGAQVSLQLPTPIPGTVALDMAAKPCSASWSNNGEYLPCPGNLDQITDGYADSFDSAVIAGAIQVNQPGLLTIPAQSESQFAAIFGKFPPFTVMQGDRFRAVLACADGHPDCAAALSLEYFTSDNRVIQLPDAKWEIASTQESPYTIVDLDLDLLAGQTVQFLLAVRDNGDPEDDYALWIIPHIARIGGAATDAIPPNPAGITGKETVPVSGIVDMRSAPPYLYDDHPPGSPASVVFFDLSSAMFLTVSTKNTHPDFSIDVFPGEYHVLAYSYGVGDVPYVSGAYTGIDPSCGQPMAVLEVLPDKPLSGVIINDWNWSCGGTAERLEKPEEVSLP